MDFVCFLDEIGTTVEQVRAYREGLRDIAPLASEFEHVRPMPSAIDGIGLFTTVALRKNQLIAPARIHGTETVAGRYVNHSHEPNARMVLDMAGTPLLVALRNIAGDLKEEIVVDYRQARQVLGLRAAQVERQPELSTRVNT